MNNIRLLKGIMHELEYYVEKENGPIGLVDDIFRAEKIKRGNK